LKVLSPLLADPTSLARFAREAQILAGLNHPNNAAIYGVDEGDSIHALVLELVEGETLATRPARPALSISEAIPIAKRIASALEAAHGQDMIHRDLKPSTPARDVPSRDGQRFLSNTLVEGARSDIIVVLNWMAPAKY
jgi:serine/threonine-protein kinase